MKKVKETLRWMRTMVSMLLEMVIVFLVIMITGGAIFMHEPMLELLKGLLKLFKDFYLEAWSKEAFFCTIFATVVASLVGATLFCKNKKKLRRKNLPNKAKHKTSEE